MLSMMIFGPKQLGNDIDVYLTPLIEDLKLFWDEGVEVFDEFAGETFKMHAMLFYIINDFLKNEYLSGYSVKGHKVCPIYKEDTVSQQLKHGRKGVYLRYQRFLRSHLIFIED